MGKPRSHVQRLHDEYDRLYQEKQKWLKRALVMRAHVTRQTRELRERTSGDSTWDEAWAWAKETVSPLIIKTDTVEPDYQI